MKKTSSRLRAGRAIDCERRVSILTVKRVQDDSAVQLYRAKMSVYPAGGVGGGTDGGGSPSKNQSSSREKKVPAGSSPTTP